MSASNVTSGLVARGTTFVVGKGGVGKSTIARALALAAAAKGESVLLVRIDETAARTESLRSHLHRADGFEEVSLSGRGAMDEYVSKVVKVDALASRIVESDVYARFFAAAPGLRELVLLGRIRAFAMEKSGLRRECPFDHIIVDCPSSGHGILMFETPFSARRAIPVGALGQRAQEVIDWLKSDEVGIMSVAIPEEMAVVEALETAGRLFTGTGLKPRDVVLNRVDRVQLSAETRRMLRDYDVSADSAPGPDAVLVACGKRALRRNRLHEFHARRLRSGFKSARFLELPEILDQPKNSVAERLAHALQHA